MREGERFDERARDVEKVVHELERPADQRQRMDERPRPEKQNDDETGSDIRPCGYAAFRKDRAGIFDEEIKRDALNDAAKRELDLDDHRVEFLAAASGGSHDASRTRLKGGKSIPLARLAATVTLRSNSAEILRVNGEPEPIKDNGPLSGPQIL